MQVPKPYDTHPIIKNLFLLCVQEEKCGQHHVHRLSLVFGFFCFLFSWDYFCLTTAINWYIIFKPVVCRPRTLLQCWMIYLSFVRFVWMFDIFINYDIYNGSFNSCVQILCKGNKPLDYPAHTYALL